LFPQWPVAHNAFDGFIHFSPVSGRGGMILDGDAIRLNTLASDTERETCISLYTIAGSPVPIADEPDTIGASAWIYTNPEILALGKLGFAGKPLSPALDSPDSQRWAGQTPTGDWIVGLFNRESSPQTRGVDYASELGVTQPAATRDLWSHADLGALASYSDSLVAHDSRVLRIVTGRWKFEAEVAALVGGAMFNNNHSGASAFGFVDHLTAPGAAVRFDVDIGSSSASQLLIRYADGGAIDKTATVRINGNPKPAGAVVVLSDPPKGGLEIVQIWQGGDITMSSARTSCAR
jgi:alpha-glucosidase